MLRRLMLRNKNNMNKILESKKGLMCYSLVLFSAIILVFLLPNSETFAQKYTDDDSNTLLIATKDGTVTIRMHPEIAPRHVRRIKKLVRSGYYKGSTFHRVIPGVLVQTGDPSGVNKGSGKKIQAEFSRFKHTRGVVSMARYKGENTADDQFFIVLDKMPHLDGKYTIWGMVVAGMDFIEGVKEGDPKTGKVKNPDKVLGMWIASDAAIETEKRERKRKSDESKRKR